MATIIETSDLPEALRAHELVETMVAGANAKASRVAPCLVAAVAAADPTDEQQAQVAEAKLILIGAVKRWVEAGAGSFAQQTAGPFSVSTDTRQRAGFNLWPSEIQGLQDICSSGSVGRTAFSIDTVPADDATHADWCSVNFGAAYCSCGADIAGFPIYEQG